MDDATVPPSHAPQPEASRRRAPVRPSPARSAAGLLLAAALVACGGGPSSAQQEAAVVPSDRSTIQQRADRSRSRGDTTRPITILEISDFQCPYCAQFYRETYPGLDSLYLETGKAQFIFISYPSSGHARAWPAAEAAFCAGAVGRFWPMHDSLFANQEAWSQAEDPTEMFVDWATGIGVEEASYRACLRNDLTSQVMVRDLEQVANARISATPFFIINNSVPIQGAQPLEAFRTKIDSLLREQGLEGSGTAAGSDGGEAAGGDSDSAGADGGGG